MGYKILYKTLLFIFPVLIILTPINSNAQSDSIPGSTRINGEYFLSYWQDTKTITTEPIRWKGKQWSRFAGIVGLGLITYAYDQEVFDFFQRNQSTTADNISRYLIEPWGSGLYSLPLMAGIYLTGAKDSHHRRVALTGVKAFILSGGAAFVTKNIFHRHRPSDNSPPDPYRWDGPFPFTSNYTSFPSGHTATAFAIASVLALGYPDKIWIGISAYTVAGLVGVSRVYDGEHWGSDVLAGAALGAFIGVTLSKLNLKKIEIMPVGFHGGQGVRVSYRID